MIGSLRLHILLKETAIASFRSGFHTNSILLRNFRKRKIPNNFDEPDVKSQRDILEENSDYPDEIIQEHELHDDLDMTKIDKIYANAWEESKSQSRIKLKIAAQKFFSPRVQPSMLTYNERLCIQYLHKEDPVQWNLNALSESFPATPDTIKKILKSKRKITPEIAKKMDSVVQKNWELLSKGMLDADPHVLNHLKKFVNKRKVLVEQIKNDKFYLPERKEEPNWNQGDMNNIYKLYEKDLKRLVQESSPKALPGELNDKSEEKKSDLDLVYDQIKAESEKIPENKDSFKFGEMLNTFEKRMTLVELENSILKKAEKRKELSLTEKIILDSKLNIRKESSESSIQRSGMQGKFDERGENYRFKTMTAEEKMQKKTVENNSIKSDTRPKEISYVVNNTPCNDNTWHGSEFSVGRILKELENKSQVKKKEAGAENTNKSEFSHLESVEQENSMYDDSELSIKDTAFWDNRRSSKEKALAEFQKRELDEPVNSDNIKIPKVFVFSPDPYPERIKIPKDKRGSGLTFRIKDCYYDDDGEFLYRVPGMKS